MWLSVLLETCSIDSVVNFELVKTFKDFPSKKCKGHTELTYKGSMWDTKLTIMSPNGGPSGPQTDLYVTIDK